MCTDDYMTVFDPTSLGADSLVGVDTIANQFEYLIQEYGPDLVVKYLIYKLTKRSGFDREVECKFINLLQEGKTEKAAMLIQQYDEENASNLTEEVQQVARELENAENAKLSDFH